MPIVTLVSGGLDSTLMAVLTEESGLLQFPLFVNYGQVFCKREYDACISSFKKLGLPRPHSMDVSGFGHLIPSGLTSRRKHVVRDAFLPNRNLLFLVCAGAYAHLTGANAVAVGLLSEETHLFPDQTRDFLSSAEATMSVSLGHELSVVAPLSRFRKAHVVALAQEKGITAWYSCHTGRKRPCGRCISCREYKFSEQ
ncbi:MAG: 7-cyano-7-deazaguanine synthase [Acidobacteriota bacterium]|nr:7-cyano-7-deazaguanine synthase [Acidobacteriota bacterium]MDE3170632.1 7-cyano-7-deazaguanine synthase [Acidobacteriota bacterium]